jgi:hypothetical protein
MFWSAPLVGASVVCGKKYAAPEGKKRFSAWKAGFSPVASALPGGMQIFTGD